MTANTQVQDLHDAYCSALAIELPLTMTFERWWLAASNNGLTPDHVRLCVKERLRFNLGNSFKKGLELRHLIRDEDDVAIMLNEAAVVRANTRIKVMEPAKASVLRATGRSDEVPTSEAKRVGDLELIERLRRAAE